MEKKLLLLVFLFSGSILQAQIPQGKFQLLFKRSNADATIASSLYNDSLALGSMRNNNAGQIPLLIAEHDTARTKNTISTWLLSPLNYSEYASVSDNGSFEASSMPVAASLNLIGDSAREFILYNRIYNITEENTPFLKVFLGVNGNLLHQGRSESGMQRYFFPKRYRPEQGNFDLTGDGFDEFVGLSRPMGGPPAVYIFDGVQRKIQLHDERLLIPSPYTDVRVQLTDDLNDDGKPELVSWVNFEPDFFQWDQDSNSFVRIGGMPITYYLWSSPEEIDGDGNKEIITYMGETNTVKIYNADFSLKYQLDISPSFIGAWNVNDSPNKELIVCGMNPEQKTLTAVYDFSVGSEPVWIDTNFRLDAVGDFLGNGSIQFLGASLYSNRMVIRLINSGDFSELWSFDGAGYITGPSKEGKLLSSENLVGAINPVDFNGDGIKDIVVGKIAIDMLGRVIDTLDIHGSNSITVCDFNNNGMPELLITEQYFARYSPSIVKIFEFQSPTSVCLPPSQDEGAIVRISPNPAHETANIQISLAQAGSVSIKLYSILGLEVATVADMFLERGTHDFHCNLSQFTPGEYYYKIQTEKFSKVESFVIMH
ncbi:MAG TPA: T9SS type A sorting domain-containing protein [Patescibacteria group bacterium]|nr:T9SS type A sorting domain-containing protein [Patescibacteria group bacterium]